MFIVVREKLLQNIIHSRKFLKFTNKTFHKCFGSGIKETINKHPHVKTALQKTKSIWDYFDLLTELS